MFYYIYYGYTLYKVYEYSHILKFTYNTINYTYGLANKLYKITMGPGKEKLEEWELIEL